MPLYEYRCRACGMRMETLRRVGQGAEGLACPSCGHEDLEKQPSTFASSAGGGADTGSAGGCGTGGRFT